MKRILWFRRDLRAEDNPLLSLGGEVLPIFIFDTHILGGLARDDRRVSFIFQAVLKLKEALRQKGLDLKVCLGDPVEIFAHLETLGFDEAAASGDYDAYAGQRDIRVSHILHFRYLHDTYIFEPNEILKEDKTPYLVFTPFYNKAKAHFSKQHLSAYTFAEDQRLFGASYEGVTVFKEQQQACLPLAIESLGFSENMPKVESPQIKLEQLKKTLSFYQHDRDDMHKEATSHLSCDLRFGTVSVRTVLRFLAEQKKQGVQTEPFFRQLVFRDFYAYLLYHFPYLEKENYKYRFKGIEDEVKYDLFCKGMTGVPLIDAGVRELLGTGLMHNRVRMVCASFFTKDLLLPWQWGEAFFAKHLLDYDAASNVLSWQWSAGTGIDPQPYFRIFNPYMQSKKFDKEARYIKKWVPELAFAEAKRLHDEAFLHTHGIKGYPKPIVCHKEASQKALEYFKGRLN
ncbi:MAG: deoxyribodipyrimidine photo-lyase [Sulfurovum sp.]|nr:deoxyribodipyrimidine photo-lyase [Sulfurovum sp.]